MRIELRSLAILVAFFLAAQAKAGEGTRPRSARLPCPQDAPEGVRLPDRPDCASRTVPSTRETDGFRDAGGLRVRVGGRVSAGYGAAR